MQHYPVQAAKDRFITEDSESISWNPRARMCPGQRSSLETGSGNCQELRNIVPFLLSVFCFCFYFSSSLPAAWLSLSLNAYGRRWPHHITQVLYFLHPQADPSMRVEALCPNSKFPGEENLISPVWATCVSQSNQRKWCPMVQAWPSESPHHRWGWSLRGVL